MLITFAALFTYILVRLVIPILLLIGLGEWLRRNGDPLRSL